MDNIIDYSDIINVIKKKNLIKENKDEKILIRLYEIYSKDNINKNFMLYKYINNIDRIHSNILGWLCSTIYKEKNSHNNFINVISNYMSKKYNIDCYSLLNYLSDCNISNSSLNPESIIKIIINSIDESETFDRFKEHFSNYIKSFVHSYDIENSLSNPIVNKKTVNSMASDPTNDILKSLDKSYKVYYILTKINESFCIVYIGSGNIKRLKDPREKEFIREFVNNIPNCDKNLYLIPEPTSLTKEYSILREKNKIKYFRDNGFLLSNIIHYNYINNIEITDKNKLNKLLSENNTNIFNLREYKIKSINTNKFMCIPITEKHSIENYII